MKKFLQLKKDLAARGADMIIMPFAPNPQYAGHLLVDGIEADQDYYPGWSEMVIQLLENDIEVIDTVTEFRQAAGSEVQLAWPNDFHTASLGRQIAAKALAERLQRYDFARELAPNKDKWKTTQKSTNCKKTRITTVNGAIGRFRTSQVAEGARTWPSKRPNTVMALKPDAPPNLMDEVEKVQVNYLEISGPKDTSLMRTDFVMIGDSQLHSAVYGAGLPAFIMSEVGGIFPLGRARAASIYPRCTVK